MADAEQMIRDALTAIVATGELTIDSIPEYKKFKRKTRKMRREFFDDLEDGIGYEFDQKQRAIAALALVLLDD